MERAQKSLRLIDQYLGPLALLLLKPFFLSRRKLKLDTVQAVGLIKMAAIGDTVLLSALVSDLKRWKPSLRIILFTGASNFEMARLIEGVDLVEKLPLKDPFTALSKLRAQHLDLLFDTDSWPRISAFYSAFSKAKLTVGFKTPGQNRDFLYDVKVPHSAGCHEIENFRHLLQVCKIPTGQPPQDFKSPWSAKNVQNQVLLHLWPGGTKSHLREWPMTKWRDLALALIEKENCQIGLTGSPSEFEKNQNFLNSLPPQMQKYFKNLAGASLQELIFLLRDCRLLISVNTGVMHLGAAIGTPTLGLHGPTSPLRWGPVGARTKSLLSPAPQSGHLNLGFEYFDDLNRTESLSISEVLRVSEQLLVETKK